MSRTYDKKVEVYFRNEHYTVKCDGSIYRHKKPGKKCRPLDCNWMFGNESESHPYLTVSGIRVHQIIATAYHGVSPGPGYVVDHIDTNCRNNRPENLRWITRLENALLNPITRKKIEYHCGSIESFLENPSQMNDYSNLLNYSWMGLVTKEEAQNCKERMLEWAKTENGSTFESKGPLGEWIYNPMHKVIRKEIKPLTKSLTPNCYQKNWRVPSAFPFCPEEVIERPLVQYYNCIRTGEVFAVNDKYPDSFVLDKAYGKNNESILILCTREGMKPWVLAEVVFEDEKFIQI